MFGLRRRKRESILRWDGLVIVPAALAFSMLVCAVLLLVEGHAPLHGLQVLWEGYFGAGWALSDPPRKAVPIFLCSMGVAVAFRLQTWNIGATWVVLTFGHLPWQLMLPFMLLASGAAGALWVLIPACLRIWLNVNEIISTLLLNYVAILLLDYLVYGAWKDPASFGFPMTMEFPESAVIGVIPGTSQHWWMSFPHRTRRKSQTSA
jgi:general nucleoside transport system permease protein